MASTNTIFTVRKFTQRCKTFCDSVEDEAPKKAALIASAAIASTTKKVFKRTAK